MTIEECNSAAYKRFAVICRGIVYTRIAKISRVFTSEIMFERGFPKTYYTVTLEDKTRNSFTETTPEEVELANVALKKELLKSENF